MRGMKDVGPWYTALGVPKGKLLRYLVVGEKGAEKTTQLMYWFVSHESNESCFELQHDIDRNTYAALKNTETAFKDVHNRVI